MKLSEDKIKALQDGMLSDSVHIMRYLNEHFAEQEKREKKRNNINLIINIFAVVFSAIAAIGVITQIILQTI